MKTFVDGTEEEVLQPCTGSIFHPLQGCKRTHTKSQLTTQKPQTGECAGGRVASRHGLQRLGGAVGQSLPQVQDLDHRQDAQVLGQAAAPQLLGLARRAPVREFPLTPTSKAAQKHTHPLHGEQLDLVGSAFEESENVLEDRDGALQVTCGPLTHCTTHPTDYQLIRNMNINTGLWPPPVK